MAFSMGWIFHSWAQWSIYIFILIASFIGHLMFNHQEERNGVGGASEKRLNMGKYAFFTLAFAFAGVAGEVVNKEPAARSNLPVLFAAWVFLLWDAGDWFSLLVFRAATNKHGGRGWLRDAVLTARGWGDKVRKAVGGIHVPRSVKVLLILMISAVIITACTLIVPEYTPSSPQQTSFWSNTQIVGATATAEAMSPIGDTGTPTPTATPTLTPCCGEIVEVTPPSEATPSLIVLGDANEPPKPGVWYWGNGSYYSYENWNVRACEDKTCAVVGGLSAGQTVKTVGGALDGAGALWLCLDGVQGRDYGQDAHGAQWCNQAFLAWDPVESWNGIYEVRQ